MPLKDLLFPETRRSCLKCLAMWGQMGQCPSQIVPTPNTLLPLPLPSGIQRISHLMTDRLHSSVLSSAQQLCLHTPALPLLAAGGCLSGSHHPSSAWVRGSCQWGLGCWKQWKGSSQSQPAAFSSQCLAWMAGGREQQCGRGEEYPAMSIMEEPLLSLVKQGMNSPAQLAYHHLSELWCLSWCPDLHHSKGPLIRPTQLWLKPWTLQSR